MFFFVIDINYSKTDDEIELIWDWVREHRRFPGFWIKSESIFPLK